MNTKTLFLLCASIFFLSSCQGTSQTPVEKEGFQMGTVIREKIYGEKAQEAADKVMNRIKEIEDRMTNKKSDSQIYKLNEQSGTEKVKVTDDVFFVLNNALKYAKEGNGAFDVTVGPLVNVWGIFTENPKVPSKEEITNLKKLVDYKDIILDEPTKTAKLNRKGQIVNLGGIAKGYAGDESIKVCKELGITSACINLGGNVVVLGNKPDGSKWKIGIQNPRAENGKYIGIVEVSDTAVVTSGDYERYFEKDGERYHHILDPRTGYPAKSGLTSTTIITKSSIEADAINKIAFISGLDEGMKAVKRLGVEAIFITDDKKVYTTAGLKNIFKFEDETNQYTLVN